MTFTSLSMQYYKYCAYQTQQQIDMFSGYWWEYAMTMYHENIDKTMIIKFYKSNDNGFTESEDGYIYLYGYWYFIDGKL
ncbi:MAG: hypothetical protein FWG07_08235 [Treponema sp.]|nr:hypothetical protein [Treponema sp.]